MPLLTTLPAAPAGKSGWPWTLETDPELYRNGSDWPKITLVTPSYNQGAFIEETIRSVLLQNYPNLEYLIIDGGSTDETLSVIRKYEPWITQWVSEPDDGQSDAINKGFRKSTGIILNWLNSDDTLLSHALFTVASLWQVEPNAGLICGFREAEIIGSGVKEMQGYWPEYWLDYLLCIPHFPQDATFFTKALLDQVGEIDRNLHYLMDVDFYGRCLTVDGFKHLFTYSPLSRMTIYPEQKTLSESPRKANEWRIVKSKYRQLPAYIRVLRFILSSKAYLLVYKFLQILLRQKAKKRFKMVEYQPLTQRWMITPFRLK